MNKLFLLPADKKLGNIYDDEISSSQLLFPYTKTVNKNVSFNDTVQVKDNNIIEKIIDVIDETIPVPNGTAFNKPKSEEKSIEGYDNMGGISYSDY